MQITNLSYRAVSLLWCILFLGLAASGELWLFLARKGCSDTAAWLFPLLHRCWAGTLLTGTAASSRELHEQLHGVAYPHHTPVLSRSMGTQGFLFPQAACPAPSQPSLYYGHRSGTAVQINLSLKVIHPSGRRLTAWVLRGITGKESVQTGRKC